MAPLPVGWRLRAATTALVVLPLLECVSFARIERTLDGLGRLLPAARVDHAAAARWIDGLLSRLSGPWHFTCLRRATILYHLLRSAGAPMTLCIGVRRETDGSLHAHAWLLEGEALVLESGLSAERVPMFTEIARFPSAGAATAA